MDLKRRTSVRRAAPPGLRVPRLRFVAAVTGLLSTVVLWVVWNQVAATSAARPAVAIGFVTALASAALFTTTLFAGPRRWVEWPASAVVVAMLFVSFGIDDVAPRVAVALVSGAAVAGVFVSYVARWVTDAANRTAR